MENKCWEALERLPFWGDFFSEGQSRWEQKPGTGTDALTRERRDGMKKIIRRFRLEYDYLSNFYPACVQVDGLEYLCAEAAFQAAKCANWQDRLRFQELYANDSKRLGHQVPQRGDWEEVKVREMEKIVRAKFAQNPHLAQFLLETGDAELVEGNPWHDTFWGVDLKTGQGENHLGRILMALREEFQQNGIPDRNSASPCRQEVSEDGIRVQFRDITQISCECIVNAANETLLGGGGVDAAIHRAAGPGLLEECRGLGGCRVTEAKMTGGYRLPTNYVIHTVGPHYGVQGASHLLALTYRNVLDLAEKNKIHSIAFPAISAGKFSYPKKQATMIGVSSVRQWKREHPEYPLEVIFADVDLTTYRYFCEAIKRDSP